MKPWVEEAFEPRACFAEVGFGELGPNKKVERFLLRNLKVKKRGCPSEQEFGKTIRSEQAGEEQVECREPIQDTLFLPERRSMATGFESLDMVDLEKVFEERAFVMKSVPGFMKGAFQGALKISLEEIRKGQVARNAETSTRGWKLFVLLPRMLLCRPPRGGLIPRKRLEERLAAFNAGDWVCKCGRVFFGVRRCKAGRMMSRIERRRWSNSSGVDERESETKKPRRGLDHDIPLHLDEDKFLHNLRTSRRAVVGGPCDSGASQNRVGQSVMHESLVTSQTKW